MGSSCPPPLQPPDRILIFPDPSRLMGPESCTSVWHCHSVTLRVRVRSFKLAEFPPWVPEIQNCAHVRPSMYKLLPSKSHKSKPYLFQLTPHPPFLPNPSLSSSPNRPGRPGRPGRPVPGGAPSNDPWGGWGNVKQGSSFRPASTLLIHRTRLPKRNLCILQACLPYRVHWLQWILGSHLVAIRWGE